MGLRPRAREARAWSFAMKVVPYSANTCGQYLPKRKRKSLTSMYQVYKSELPDNIIRLFSSFIWCLFFCISNFMKSITVYAASLERRRREPLGGPGGMPPPPRKLWNLEVQKCFCKHFLMYKKYKRLVYTPPDLLARFCKVNLSSAKNSAWFVFQEFVFQS